ncbi:DUF6216 family protein [Cupriavidus basilensis]|uniref:DUF6216 family protein n=1 Tax=Cupriavidus basilensis TaxID=68895 RepID=UPI003C2D2989
MESLSAFVQSPLFSRLSIVITGLALLVLFWWRAGSIHSILERLWLLIAGKAEVHDPELKSIFQKNRDLEKFRFFYRLKVEPLADVRKLAAWMEVHGVGMSRLQRMRRWVDIRCKRPAIAVLDGGRRNQIVMQEGVMELARRGSPTLQRRPRAAVLRSG